jgi:hypothetical protein
MNLFSRYFIIGAIAAVLFIPFLGKAHLFDWDEVNFAESAREMIVSHNYGVVQINYKPFWEKPPFFIWMQMISMRLFGINEFAARLPDALTGILTLMVLFCCGKKLGGDEQGYLWVMAYAGSWLPFLYFKSGIIDPVFNLLIFCAIWKLSRIAFSPVPWRKAAWSGLFLGLAVLTKGPVAILICGLVLGVYLIWKKGSTGIRWNHLGLTALIAAAVTCAWFGYIAAVSGWGLIGQFISYQARLFSTQDSGHGGPFLYHWYILLFGCFPASLFLVAWFKRFSPGGRAQGNLENDFIRWMWILFGVVLILFSIVKTKIVHYSSLCYFPLTYLAALRIRDFLQQARMPRWVILALAALGMVTGFALIAIPLAALHPAWLAARFADPFAKANLQAQVPWSWADCLYGTIYCLLILWAAACLWQERLRRGLMIILVAQLALMEATVVMFTPRIEAYTQQAAIRFYESLQGKDVYVHVLGFKSYAQLFYSRELPQRNPLYDDEHWLLYGHIDKPAYFVCKITSASFFGVNPKLQKIGEKNGFVFYRRDP